MDTLERVQQRRVVELALPYTRREWWGVPCGVVEVSPDDSAQGKGVQPLIEGCSFSDGELPMRVHNPKRWDPWEVDVQCNAIFVAGRVQGAIPLYAVMPEEDHVGGNVIVVQLPYSGQACAVYAMCAVPVRKHTSWKQIIMGLDAVVSWSRCPIASGSNVKREELHRVGRRAWIGRNLVSQCHEAMSERIHVSGHAVVPPAPTHESRPLTSLPLPTGLPSHYP